MIDEQSKIFKNYSDLLPEFKNNKNLSPSLKYNNDETYIINELNEILNNLFI